MADDVKLQLECSQYLTKHHGKVWQPAERPQAGRCGFCKYIEKHICQPKNSTEEQIMKITQVEGEVSKAKAEFQESRVANRSGRALPSRGPTGQTPVSTMQQQLASFRGVKKLL